MTNIPETGRTPRVQIRLVILQVLVFSLLLTLGGRLWYLQIRNGAEYADKAKNNHVQQVVQPAVRGSVLDARGVPLADNETRLVVSASRTDLMKIKDKGKDVLTRLAGILDMKPQEVMDKVRLCDAKTPSPAGTVPRTSRSRSPCRPPPSRPCRSASAPRTSPASPPNPPPYAATRPPAAPTPARSSATSRPSPTTRSRPPRPPTRRSCAPTRSAASAWSAPTTRNCAASPASPATRSTTSAASSARPRTTPRSPAPTWSPASTPGSRRSPSTS